MLIAETVAGGETLMAVLSVAQFLVSILLGIIGYLLKRQIDQGDRKLEGLCARVGKIEAKGAEAVVDSVIADGIIREKLAGGYVSKADCNDCKGERRQTTTLLFSKIERLQEGQAKAAGKLDALIGLARKDGP